MNWWRIRSLKVWSLGAHPATLATLIWLALGYVLPSLGEAQRYFVQTYTENDGLPSSTVQDIVQDEAGRMWFATRNGIAMYDGVEWTIFGSADGLSHAAQEGLDLDEDGGLWAVSAIMPFEVTFLRDGAWHSFIPPPLDDVGVRRITAFTVTRLGEEVKIAVVTELSELFLWHGNTWRRLTPESGLPGKVTTLASHAGRIWVGTSQGLFVLDFADPNVLDKNQTVFDQTVFDQTVFDQTVRPRVKTPEVRGLVFQQRPTGGRLWMMGLGWSGYLDDDGHFTPVAGGIAHPSDRASEMVRLAPDRHGGVFLGHQRGLLHLTADGQEENLGVAAGLISKDAASVLVDREENLWVSGSRGVSKVSSFRFATYRSEHGLLEDEVTAVIERADGSIVLGHPSGLTFLEGETKRRHRLIATDSSTAWQVRALDLAEDETGSLWLAASSLGLLLIDAGGDLHQVPVEGTRTVNSVVTGEGGRLWICGTEKLFERRGSKFVEVDGAPRVEYRRIFLGPEGRLYVASAGQGVWVRAEDGTWKAWRSSAKRGDNVYSVLVEDQGRTWVGTGGGLFQRQPGADELDPVFFAGQRLARPVYFLLRDTKNHLWIGTDNGVFRWDSRSLEHFTVRHGLGGRETNRAAGMVDQRGHVWIGMDQGVSVYDPARDRRIQPAAPELLDLETRGLRYLLTKPLSLRHDENDLVFRFRALSFVDEKRLDFRVRLEGFDLDWSTPFTSANQEVSYSRLPPGDYRFYLQVRNVFGLWSEQASSARIRIERSIWAQSWFTLPLAAVVFGLLFLVWRFIAGRRHANRLEQEVRLRTRELTESETRYRRLVETISDGLAYADEDGVTRYVNDRFCQMFGRTREQTVGFEVRSLFGRANRAIIDREFDRRKRGANDPYELELSAPGGEAKVILISPSPLFDEDGRFQGSLAIFTDITARKGAEAPTFALPDS